MYFPPYESLLRTAGLNKVEVSSSDRVTIPKKLFEFLVQTALATSDFEESTYLQANPDVREAVSRGTLVNAKQHFIGYGYFEGRPGALPKVDEAWYLQTYKDVAGAISSGKVVSASKHFEVAGVSEGRAPTRAYLDVAGQWKDILKAD